jgi:outer membrane biosynthesis protein TonB
VLLLPLLLTACSHFPFHKEKQPPARQTAPPVQEAPPKPVTPPAEPLPPPVSVPKPVVVIDQDAQKPKKPKASHKKQAEKPVEQAANETPDAGAAAASSVSAIGQLSSGEPSELFRKTSDSITATERGLNGVNRTLSDAEKKTAEHIRDFIKQARVALAAGDVDGASILAAKAKVLLAELSQ